MHIMFSLNEIGLEQVEAFSTRANKPEGRVRRPNVQVNYKNNQLQNNEGNNYIVN